MKRIIKASAVLGLLIATSCAAAAQLAGEPFIHDPSTITFSDGR